MVYLIAFITLVLASARLTRVLVFDEIATPLRNWVFNRWPAPSKPAKLFSCYWCAGFWASAALCAFALAGAAANSVMPWLALPWLLPPLTFAVAYASSWVLDREGI